MHVHVLNVDPSSRPTYHCIETDMFEKHIFLFNHVHYDGCRAKVS